MNTQRISNKLHAIACKCGKLFSKRHYGMSCARCKTKVSHVAERTVRYKIKTKNVIERLK